jgi:hypothetical protein
MGNAESEKEDKEIGRLMVRILKTSIRSFG